jgi:FhuF 2Fe-2S C-terminal domain
VLAVPPAAAAGAGAGAAAGAAAAAAGAAGAAAAAALRAASSIGPFFAVELDASGTGWRPLRELIDDPRVLAGRVAVARSGIARSSGLRLDQVDLRATASIWFLGFAARLLSPVFGGAVLTGTVPTPAVDELWWRAVDGGPIPLAVSPTVGCSAAGLAGRALAAAIQRTSLDGPIAALKSAVGAAFTVSPLVLNGNVASALGGSVRMLAAAAPDLAGTAADLALRLLADGSLSGTGELVRPDPGSPSWFFVRRSCCLFYWIPGAGTCADCVLVPPEVRRRQWREAAGPG